jgi:hypothetical protein
MLPRCQVAIRFFQIGIRMALGPPRDNVIRLMLRNAMTLVALGTGLAGARAAIRVVRKNKIRRYTAFFMSPYS